MHVNYRKMLWNNHLGRWGLIILSALIIIALFAPFITYDPRSYSTDRFEPPSFLHLLGTNDIGQDIFSRIVYGARTSLLIAFSVGTFSTFLTTLLGTSAALRGGRYEEIAMRCVDASMVLPDTIILIIIATFVKPTLGMLIILMSALEWGGARIIRSQTLSLKERRHVLAARSFGGSKLYLLAKHIIPDLSPIIVVHFVFSARRAVFQEAALAFLGIFDPAMISWGTMINHARNYCYLDVWMWWLIPPAVVLSLLILSLVFLGYTIEEIMDPRLRLKKGEEKNA
jgi:peptide/nickel transport system permease protein